MLLLTCIKQVTKYIVNCVLSGRDKIIWERSEAATGALACNFIKIETLAQVFSGEFCKISKNTFFTEHVWGTASRRFSTVDLMSMIALRRIIFFLSITTMYEPCFAMSGGRRKKSLNFFSLRLRGWIKKVLIALVYWFLIRKTKLFLIYFFPSVNRRGCNF